MSLDTNVLYYGDNLDVLRRHIPDESIDLIYLDPPFNSSRTYNVLFKEHTGAGSEAQIEAFEDTWHWGPAAQAVFEELVTGPHQDVGRMLKAMVDGLGHNDVTAYLTMMAIRLVELRNKLKQAGSIYLHCDSTTGPYLRVLMDAIFGPKNFRNEIVWKRANAHNDPKRYGRITDTLLFYNKGREFVWNTQYVPYREEYLRQSLSQGRRWKVVSYRTRRCSSAWRGQSGSPLRMEREVACS